MSFTYNQWRNLNWITWDGRQVSMNTIDQQHLSNVYYFMKYIRGCNSTEFEDAVFDELIARFDGKLLPYVPVFPEEISYIFKKGWVKRDFTICIDGEDVGKLQIN